MSGKKFQFSLCIALLLVLCSGCNNDSASIKNASGVDFDSTEASPTNTKAHAKPVQGKPGAQISLTSNQVYQLEPGVAAEVSLGLVAPYQEGRIIVSIKTSEGLRLVSEEENYLFDMAPDAEYLLPLNLLATSPGRYYVNLQINLIHDGRETFKSISAIVQVGSERDGNVSIKQEKAGSSDGVVSLPAQEVIISE